MAEGDIRVLIVLDVILSAIYAALVVYGLSYIDLVPFTLENVAMLAVALALVTYLAVLR